MSSGTGEFEQCPKPGQTPKPILASTSTRRRSNRLLRSPVGSTVPPGPTRCRHTQQRPMHAQAVEWFGRAVRSFTMRLPMARSLDPDFVCASIGALPWAPQREAYARRGPPTPVRCTPSALRLSPLPEGARSLPRILRPVRLACAPAPQPITTQRGKVRSLPRPAPRAMPPRRRRQATPGPCILWYLRWIIYSWILALSFWPSAHK